jgi:hypothetical protein
MTNVELSLRNKIGSNDEAEQIINEVKECPDYFVMEGGADGTFAHVRFFDDFGHLMPEIADFAEECGGRV